MIILQGIYLVLLSKFKTVFYSSFKNKYPLNTILDNDTAVNIPNNHVILKGRVCEVDRKHGKVTHPAHIISTSSTTKP